MRRRVGAHGVTATSTVGTVAVAIVHPVPADDVFCAQRGAFVHGVHRRDPGGVRFGCSGHHMHAPRPRA